jgi:hypothetical protein
MDKPVINDFIAALKPGQKIAIVGHTEAADCQKGRGCLWPTGLFRFE